MAMVKYSPWDVGDLQKQIDRVFRNWGDPDSSSATAGWIPNVDIREFSDRFQLFVDLPGVDPDEVEITLDNGALSISGNRITPAEPDGQDMVNYRSERGHGQFFRRFILPDTVDAENVKASNHLGVLEVRIPKQAKALPRRIKVAA